MTAQITRQAIDSITIEVTMPLTGSMLQAEEAIQDASMKLAGLPPKRISSGSIPMEAPSNSVPSA